MPTEYRVNGPAILYVSLDGETVEKLAVTESGVRIGYQRFRQPIHTDVSGPRAPAELQDAGQIALVTGKMVAIDPDVLDVCRRMGDAANVGLLNTVGGLIGTGEASFHLYIDATNDRPHHFPTVTLWEGEDELVGTRRTEDNIQFYCWGFLDGDATTALNTPLWIYERPPGVP